MRRAFGLLLTCATCSAATIIVDLNGTGQYTDIQAAIDAAGDGNTVLVKAGEYLEMIDFNRLHIPDDPASPPVKNITVKSEGGPGVTTIRMSETTANPLSCLSCVCGSVVVFRSGETEESVLDGFTLTGGHGSLTGMLGLEGGGVFCLSSSPLLTNCRISGNSTESHGSAVYCHMSSPTLEGCTIAGNSSNAVHCSGGSSPILTDCVISGNSGSGVVVDSVDCSPILNRCTISGNSGSGVVGCPTLRSCIIWGNAGASTSCGVTNVSFSCIEGGESWPGDGNISADPLFCGWQGPREVYVDATAAAGGDGTRERPFNVLATALEFSLALRKESPCIGAGEAGADMGACLGACEGGGQVERVVHVAAGRYSLNGLTLDHRASLEGVSQEETVLEGTVWGLQTGANLSRVTVTGGRYGGIYIRRCESPAIRDCTISGNHTMDDGGGVYCGESSSPTLTNCTISGNLADCVGGGVYCDWDATSPTLTNCTISGNRARCSVGGGVYCCVESSPILTNCIIWGNTPESECGILFHCLTDDPLFTDPGRWDDNGTPDYPCDDVWTPGDYHLQPGSPCIDAGTSEGAPTTDIEGNARPCGNGVDIGAYEFGQCPANFPKLMRGDANSDNKIDVADAVHILSYLFAHGSAAGCLDTADANDDGKMNIADAIAVLSLLFAHTGPLKPPFGQCGIDPTIDALGCLSYPPCE